MKKFNLVLLLICTPLVVFSQLKSLNLDWEDSYYRFPIKVINDTLYTASPNGLYRKDLKLDSDWELFKFKGHQIFNFVRCGDDWIATTIGEEFRTDSLILYRVMCDLFFTFGTKCDILFYVKKDYNPKKVIDLLAFFSYNTIA